MQNMQQMVIPTHAVTIHDVEWRAPKSVSTCSICFTRVGCTPICSENHTLCQPCYDDHLAKLQWCPECRRPLDTNTTAWSIRLHDVTRTLNKTYFGCMSEGCDWQGCYQELDSHKQSCRRELIACRHEGCEKKLPRSQLQAHEQEQCPKRPYEEGHMVASFETIAEVKQLATDLQDGQNVSLPQEQRNQLLDRVIKVYDLVVTAALTKRPALDHFEATVTRTKCRPCDFQCGTVLPLPELSLHYTSCPKKPLNCRHCHSMVLNSDIVEHERSCHLRTIQCAHCRETFSPTVFDHHARVCLSTPVICTWCHRMCNMGSIEHHKKSVCPERAVDCPACLTPTVYSKLQTCWCTRPIFLTNPNNTPITLTPQLRANCPVYQEKNGDGLTLYLATQLGLFRQAIRTDSNVKMFRDGSQFDVGHERATVTFDKSQSTSQPETSPQCLSMQFEMVSLGGRGKPYSHRWAHKATPVHIDLMRNSIDSTVPFYSAKNPLHKQPLIYALLGGEAGKALLNLEDPSLARLIEGGTDQDLMLIRIKKVQ